MSGVIAVLIVLIVFIVCLVTVTPFLDSVCRSASRYREILLVSAAAPTLRLRISPLPPCLLLRRSALGGPQECLRPACRAIGSWCQLCCHPEYCRGGICVGPRNSDLRCYNRALLTVLGLSVGCTRLPSNRKRTELGDLPCLSQKASINFLRIVVRLILKKTSLLLSVTLMFRCSLTGCPSRS